MPRLAPPAGEKPRYVDLRSPLRVRGLADLLAGEGEVVVEEALPLPDHSRPVAEVVLEMDRYADA
jgi:hypothetical protein